MAKRIYKAKDKLVQRRVRGAMVEENVRTKKRRRVGKKDVEIDVNMARGPDERTSLLDESLEEEAPKVRKREPSRYDRVPDAESHPRRQSRGQSRQLSRGRETILEEDTESILESDESLESRTTDLPSRSRSHRRQAVHAIDDDATPQGRSSRFKYRSDDLRDRSARGTGDKKREQRRNANRLRYDMRHGDDDSIPLKVQPEVTVNRYGTVFTAEPLFMEGEFSSDLYDEDWGFLSDEPPMTPEQFYNAMQEKERQTVREYEIYQLNAGGRDQMFMNMKELRAMHVTPNIASYDAVYKGTLEPGMTLDSLYTKFNVERPENFKGHSLSVSDVIVVNDEHGKTAWFVDSFGFTQLPEFFAQQEQQHEVPAEGDKTYLPVYRRTADYAREAGERDEYRASYQENVKCKQAIEKAISMDYDGQYLNDNAIFTVLDVFGPERMSWVLANTITMKEHDGRFSRSNKAWAQAMSIPIDRDGFGSLRNWSYTVESHPAILDLYTTLLRKELERPSQERAAEKSVAREESKPRPEPPKPTKRKSEPSL